ncbi:MAG: zf-HC2 domain-containing protein [Candidatus Koribacter versatilis]|uniref:Zf-HC2 domain-containing protein n=1 Tax=Candidatus Korobacter versatilis TaxID=658062 RepID=A0A932A9F4_9BACT|nr:zf-HC2 domain-containing protein [Candidatus Koribacter versatilis]
MVDVSKLARARMAQAPVAGPHPDADLLTAFRERSLAAGEREQVLAHLATCADCREIVALASPDQTEEVEALAPGTAKPRGLPWPVLRWGAVATAVAVVAVAVIIEAPKRTAENAAARQAAAAGNEDKAFASAGKKVAQPSSATEQPASSDSRARADAAPKQAEVAKLEASRKEEQEKKQNGARDEDRALASAAAAPPSVQFRQDRAAEADRSTAGKATAGGAGANAQFAGRTTGLAKAKDDKNSVVLAEAPREAQAPAKPAPTPAPEVSAEGYTMARSAPAAAPARAKTSSGSLSAYGPGYAGEAAASSAPVTMDAMHAQLKPATLRWTVTSDGRVQRSPDGRVWTDVPVAKHVKFRALVANGNEVWAGGARGALYYSANAGGSWRPQPVAEVNGDIIRLNVSGQMLIISTSSGQTIEISHEVFGDQPAKPPSSR